MSSAKIKIISTSEQQRKMNDMRLIETSLHLVLRAYAGKTDKEGHGYILHPRQARSPGCGSHSLTLL